MLLDKGNGPFNPKLLPPKSFRFIVIRSCATCGYLNTLDGDETDGSANCIRPNGDGSDCAITFDIGDGYYRQAVCDRWKAMPPTPTEARAR